MERTYERQLERIASRIPDRPCIVALVPADGEEYGAALANDLAGLIGRSRPSHTLLVSLESGRSVLDHEIGVEEGAGLTEVLAGRAAVPDVASRGRARGFIYVPAGARPAPGGAILRSGAFASLCDTVLARSGTILLYVPAAALAALSGRDAADDADAAGVALPSISGVVWLGPAPDPATRSGAWLTLGALLPPGEATGESRAGESPAHGPGRAVREREPRAAAGAESGNDDPRVQALSPARRRGGRVGGRGGRSARRSRRKARQRLLATLVVAGFVAILLLIVLAVVVLPS